MNTYTLPLSSLDVLPRGGRDEEVLCVVVLWGGKGDVCFEQIVFRSAETIKRAKKGERGACACTATDICFVVVFSAGLASACCLRHWFHRCSS